MFAGNEREIREAVTAADEALYHLGKAQEHLRSARNWGIWDMLGGGLLATAVKHSKMNRAEDEMQAARDAVCHFSRELRDVSGFEGEFDGFLNFADYFFDGFLADFMVQSRIDRARERVDSAIRRITEVRAMLARELRG